MIDKCAKESKLYKLLRFCERQGSVGGRLVQFQPGLETINALPFQIGKVLVMSDIRTDDVRGNHAHYETEEILVALTGGCTVDLDDGKGRKESVHLSSCGSSGVAECGSKGVEVFLDDARTQQPPYPDTKAALLLYPHIWRVMRDFEPGTTLMVIANIKYDEADYIRDRAGFERIAKGWNGLGGSAG